MLFRSNLNLDAVEMVPTNKFIAEKGMRLPESVLLQTVTGDYVEDDIYYELLDPADIAAFYLDQGSDAVIIKLGADGAYFRTADDQAFVPAVPVAKVVDTVGAGDGFAVGVISALLGNLSMSKAVQRANWIGSRAVQSRVDMEGLPTRAELEHYLATT